MWVLGLLVFLPLLTAGLLFFIQGDRLRDAVVKVSAAAIAMLSLFVAFTYFANKYCKSNKYYGKNMFINIKKHLHRNEKSFIFANVILNTIFLP